METSIDGSAAIYNAGDHVRDILPASQNKPEITAVSNTTENFIMINDVTKNKDESDIISNVSDNAELPDSVSATSEIIDNTETLNTDNSNSDTSPETKTPKIASDKADDSDKGEARNLTSDTTSPENEVLKNSTNEIGVTEKDSRDNLISDNADKDEISADDDVDKVVVKSENPVVVIKEDPEDIEQLYKSFAYRGERKRKPTNRYVPECVLRNRKPLRVNSPEPPEEPEEKPKPPQENRCKRKNCNMVFDTKKRLFYHERNNHIEEMSVFKCMQCNIHCESNKELRDHKDCHNDDTFMCQKCELAYDNHCNYLTHSITMHYPTKKTYTCEECQRVLFDKQALKHHIQSHYNLNEQCPICNEVVHIHNLSQHRAAHNEIKCVECGKVCKGQKHYAAHLNVHIGFKPYQCIYCGKGFQNASCKRVHTDIHLGIKRHICTECNRTFRQLTDLKRHKETHQKTHKGKQLECSYCKKKFLHEISLRQHLRGHTGDHILKCPQCSKVFTTKTCLKSHIIHGHTRVFSFQCDICENQKFLTKRDLMRHYKSIRHKQRAYAVENKNNES